MAEAAKRTELIEPETKTSAEQTDVEETCATFFFPFRLLPPEQITTLQKIGLVNAKCEIKLLRDKHIKYLMTGLESLSGSYSSLDASRPWLVYWILQSLDLLENLPLTLVPRILSTLSRLQSSEGGFGGGPQQLPHCAPTYSAVLSLAIIGTKDAFSIIDRKKLYQFYLRMKQPDGGFRMHDDGEVDVRATYTVIAIAKLLNILTPQLAEGVADWLLSCQTYEGGFGGEPGNEAHGGYAFCAVAGLAILGELQRANIETLTEWICARQMSIEGGFQGRTNKLVDGCYSFWQGAIPIMLAEYLGCKYPGQEANDETHSLGSTLIDEDFLQKYILLCCQQVEGGLRDKPGKSRDYYHTCYCLSGLSVAQARTVESGPLVHGDQANRVAFVSPMYNIRRDYVERFMQFSKGLPCDHASLCGDSSLARG